MREIADQLPVRLLLLQQLLLAGNTQLRVDGTKLEQQLATAAVRLHLGDGAIEPHRITAGPLHLRSWPV